MFKPFFGFGSNNACLFASKFISATMSAGLRVVVGSGCIPDVVVEIIPSNRIKNTLGDI